MLKKLWKMTLSFFFVVTLAGQFSLSKVCAEGYWSEPLGEKTTVQEKNVIDDAQIKEELLAFRTANEKCFKMSDGSYMAMVYPKPVHYQDSEGNWSDIDNTLTPGSYRNYQAHQIQIGSMVKSFAVSTNSPFLFAVEQDGKTFQLTTKSEESDIGKNSTVLNWQSQAVDMVSDNGKLNGYTSEIAYGDILKSAELTFFNAGCDTTASLMVPKRQDKYEYSFEITLSNLHAELTSDGTVFLIDDTGKNFILINSPYLVDYAGAISNTIHYSLDNVDGKTILNVELDSEWMSAKTRIYPVTLSCTLNCLPDVQSGADITHLSQKSASASRGPEEEFYLGYSCSDDVDEAQIYLSFDCFPQISEKADILDAEIQLKQTSFSQVLCDSSEIGLYVVSANNPALGSLTWNTRPETLRGKISGAVCSDKTTDFLLQWDVTEYAKTWHQSTLPAIFALKLENIESYSKIRAMIITIEGCKSMATPLLTVRYSYPDTVADIPNMNTLSAGSAGELPVTERAKDLVFRCKDLTVQSYGGEFSFERAYAFSRGEWRLSIQQTVVKYALGSSECLIYTDSLGTEHIYFPGDNLGEYVEQSSGAVINQSFEYGQEAWVLTDDLGRTLRFINGNLISITEQSGFTVYLAYNTKYSRDNLDWLPRGVEMGDHIVQVLSSASYDVPTKHLISLQYGDSGELIGLQCGNEELRYEYLDMDGDLLLRGVHSTFSLPAAYQYDVNSRLNRAVDGSGKFGVGITYADSNTVSRVFSYTFENDAEVPNPEEIFSFSTSHQLDVSEKSSTESLTEVVVDPSGVNKGGGL